MKKNAIVLCISDSYSFLAANLLLSIRQNSSYIFETTDVIVYSSGLSLANIAALKKIKENIFFKEISSPFSKQIMDHPHIKKWGEFILQKLHIFELLYENIYKTVVFLDVDMYVSSKIDDLFNLKDYDIAFRSVAWDCSSVYPHLLTSPKKNVPMFNGGVIVFNDSITKFNIHIQDINLRSLELLRDNHPLGRGGLEEIIISYLCYYYQMKFYQLPAKFNMSIDDPNIELASIQHFSGKKDRKPWSNPIVYRSFPKWASNHQEFIRIGGKNYPDINNNSYFSDKYTFDTLKFVENNTLILKQILGKISDNRVYFNASFHSSKCCFNIKNIPESLHFEIINRKSEEFHIAFVVSEKTIISQSLVQKIKYIYEETKKISQNCTMASNENSLEVSFCCLSLNSLVICFNAFVDIVVSVIYEHFHIAV